MFVVKVPGVNGNGKTIGCEGSGNEILNVLREEIFTNESGKAIEASKLDLEEIHLDNSDLKLTNKLIYENSFEAFEEYPKTVFLGGDQSVSYSITRAFLDYCDSNGKEPCLIVFDAHPDVKELSNLKFPTNDSWLRGLIEDGFPPKNILLVGVRNSHPLETKYLKEKGIRIISMNRLEGDIENACDSIMEFSNGKELYVSLDIDVVDPAFAPSTAFPEAGGLTSRQIIYLIQRLNKVKGLRAVDIVEINEEKDKQNNNITIKLGAKLLAELI